MANLLSGLSQGFQSFVGNVPLADIQRRDQKRDLMNALGGMQPNEVIQSEQFQQLAALDPQQASTLGNLFGSIGQQREKALFEDARAVKTMLEAGHQDRALNLLGSRFDLLQRNGADASDTLEIFDDVANGRTEQALEKLRLTEQLGVQSGLLQSLKSDKKPEIGRYKSQVVGNTLVVTDSATGEVVQEITKGESEKEKLELKKLEAQVNKAETEAELKARTAQTEEDKKQASLDMATQAADLAEKILGNPALSNITGTFDAMTPVIRSESQDVLNDAKRLESLLTVDNLKLMSGVLTDKDISFLTRVGSGLNITDTGIKGSEKAVKARLNEIIAKLRGAAPKKNTVGRFTIEVE